ncbi:hypothetical protein H6G97_20660 [Nostoc flagelliforme FACHB-838]|uniref:Yip1 domain-containing protein n=1 Tax=Nostoc flagelliforme FACHB-838 TaxID=2692904 RepID=A0ABR8DQX3_9NOSO|nr:hypothetical protein [Nostoc flagelliforme FACHB-838]
MRNQPSTNGIRKVLWDVLALNANFYEDARRYPKAVKVAQVIVILAAIAHALGSVVIPLLAQVTLPLLLLIFAVNILSVVVGYYFWTFSIWKIGQQLQLPIHTYRELLIPIGFAYTPQILNFFTVIPLLGRPIEIGLSTWSLLAVIVAIKRGFNINLGRAILICLFGWLIVEIAIGVIQVIIQWLIN